MIPSGHTPSALARERELEHQVLQEIAAAAPLPGILARITALVEQRFPGALCSVHQFEPARQQLIEPVGPSLPAAYLTSVDRITIGATAGSCGTAAYSGRPVIVADIGADPLWNDFRHFAEPWGLKSCWSYPVMGSRPARRDLTPDVLGTFAIYWREPKTPEPEWTESINGAVRLASVAIEHARTIAALLASEARHRMIVDNTSDALFVHDAQGVVTDANRRALESLGTTRDELIGQSPTAFDPDIDREKLHKMLAVLSRGSPVTFESRHRRKDGTTFPVEVSISPFWVGGDRVGIGVARDISERKRAEASLHNVIDALRRAQAIAKFTVWSFDIATQTCEGDAGIVAGLTGIRATTPGAAPPQESVHPDDMARVGAAFDAALQGGHYEVEHRMLRDGQVRWVYSVATTETDETGAVVRLRGVSQDVTARRRLEEQVQQSQKMEAVGLLAGGIAHDFNNLLTVISGHSELLLNGLPADHPLCEDVVAIRDAGSRAAKLTSQLLAFSRKAIVEPRIVDLNTIVEAMADMLGRLLGETVRLAIDLDPALDPVKVDSGQMEQLLMNLAVNARDAMPDGGVLSIRTGSVLVTPPATAEYECDPGRYVSLSVADTGCGMTDDLKAHVFEPFFTTKERGKGTGLGLSTVFGIVRQARGAIRLDSTPNVGTTFTVLLPAVARAVAPTLAAVGDAPAPKGRGTILLAEDEDGVRRVVRTVLQQQGYSVLEAGSGAAALAAAVSHAGRIDLLLTDVVMPDVGGRLLADKVRAHRPGIQVLYMSGYADDALTRRGVSEEGDAFIQKPFTPRALAAKVQTVLKT